MFFSCIRKYASEADDNFTEQHLGKTLVVNTHDLNFEE